MTSGSNGTSRDHATGQEGLVDQLVCRARQQPAKAAVTGVLVLVLVVLMVRMCVRPKAAGAAPVVAVAVPVSVAPASGVPQAGATANAGAGQAVAASGIPPLDWQAMQVPLAAPRVLTRDLFAIDLRKYARASDSHKDEASAPAESPLKPVETRTETLKRQASGFRLQGTVTGPVSAAFLDETCVREGDEYRGFRITAITEQSVMLECEGVRLELRMPER